MKTALPMTRIFREFSGYPSKYSLLPLWYWNGNIQEAEIVRQLTLMKDVHINRVMIFPMLGLDVQYLSDIYFYMCEVTVTTAKKLNMKVWFYDEYAWPSGTCGGLINKQYPEYLMHSLRFYRYIIDRKKVCIHLPEGFIVSIRAINKRTGETIDLSSNINGDVLSWETSSPQQWVIYAMVSCPLQVILDSSVGSPWSYNLPGYLDVLNPDAVSCFISLTYEKYEDFLGKEFGHTIEGFFTDEPNVWYDVLIKGSYISLQTVGYGCGNYEKHYKDSLKCNDRNIYGFYWSVPWTKKLPLIFKNRFGYEIERRLLALILEKKGYEKIRHDFWMLISDLFNENFVERIGKWCAERGLCFTGHFCEGFGQGAGYRSGDLFRSLWAQQIPGMDYLGLQRDFRMLLPKAVSSVARAKGSKYSLCETHGGFYPEIQISDKVRINEQLAICGINLNAPIDFAYTLKSFRKYTSCTPGFYQSPHWPYQVYYSDRTARTNFLISQGFPTTHILAIVPIAQAISETGRNSWKSTEIEANYEELLTNLYNQQIECDILGDTCLHLAKIKNGTLKYKGVIYDTLILYRVRKLYPNTLNTIENFVSDGGKLVILGCPPYRTPEGGKLPITPMIRVLTRLKNEKKWCKEHYGKGSIIFIPDMDSEVIVSSQESGRYKIYPFDDNPDTRWAASKGYTPQFISVDFGEKVLVKGCSITWERADILYRYKIQVSNNHKDWVSLIEVAKKGMQQKIEFKPVWSRYLRVYVTDAEDAWVSIRKMDIIIQNRNGIEKLWKPSLKNNMWEILTREIEEKRYLSFYEADGCLCDKLIITRKKFYDSILLFAMNRSDREIHLFAISDDYPEIEYWNQGTGKRYYVYHEQKEKNSFHVSFAPKELKLFVLRKNASRRLPSANLSKQREVITELLPPWRFSIVGPNVFFFPICKMLDPLTKEWILSKDLTIPDRLKSIKKIRVRVEFRVKKVPKDLEFLYDDGIIYGIMLNGKELKGQRRRRIEMDEGLYSISIASFTKIGLNILECWYEPEWYARHIGNGLTYNPTTVSPRFDARLTGTFSVVEGILTSPVRYLFPPGWEMQGYPYYSGTGIYSIVVKSEVPKPIWIEADVNSGIMEVRINKSLAGVCICEPYIVDITPFWRQGSNVIEIFVTNNAIPSLIGKHLDGLSFGLRWVRLVAPK